MPNASGLRNAAAPTSTAAMPTRLWKAATSCGIAVIWILRAVTRPIAAADRDRAQDLAGNGPIDIGEHRAAADAAHGR